MALLLSGCGSDDGGGGVTAPGDASALERATRAIGECRVRSVVSLHSGVLVLELKDGTTMELAGSDHARISAEIERARPRCGDVVMAME